MKTTSPTVSLAPQIASTQRITKGTPSYTQTPPVVAGVNTAGTVRVNNLANLEYSSAVASYVLAAIFIAVGARIVYRNYKGNLTQARKSVRGFIVGSSLIGLGLSLPYTINWMITSARDAGCGDFF